MALVRGDTLFARPHSQVLAWSNWGPGKPGGGLWAWRPTTDLPAQAASNLTQITSVETPPYDIFCAGHAALPDGDLLVVSGTERGKTGEKRSARFDAASRTWLSAPMISGRWYANATVMGRLDLGGGTIAYGRVLATAGNKYDHLFGGKDAVRTRRDVWQLIRDDTDLKESYRCNSCDSLRPKSPLRCS